MLVCILTKVSYDNDLENHYITYDVKYKINDIFINFKLPEKSPQNLINLFEQCKQTNFEDYKLVLDFYNTFLNFDSNIGFQIHSIKINNESSLVVSPFANEYYNKFCINTFKTDWFNETIIDVQELSKVILDEDLDYLHSKNWFLKHNIDFEEEHIQLEWCLLPVNKLSLFDYVED